MNFIREVDPNSWQYQVLQGLEQINRAIDHLSVDELGGLKIELTFCNESIDKRISELSL